MIKRILSLLLIITIAAISVPAIASAHVVRKDGDISAELHIEPYDHPVSGEPTTYTVSFEEEPADFNLGDYTGTLTIMEGTKSIHTQALSQTKPGESEDTFTFPMAMDYTLTLVATPKAGTTGRAFTLSWPMNVEPGKKSSNVSPVAWIGGGVALLIIIGGAVLMERSSRRNKPSTE